MDECAAIAQPFVDQYELWYREVNPGGLPVIGAGEAAGFLKKSNLPPNVLGQIWEISDYRKAGSLDKRGFFMALKLVAGAQQGHQVNPQLCYQTGLAPPNIPHNNMGSRQMSPATSSWAISTVDQTKYDAIFDSLTPVNGKLDGTQVRPVLLNSGLNPQYLAKIWELADQDKDGKLDRVEMAVALHLVYKALQNDPIPGSLPTNLIHPSKAHLSRRTSIASQGGHFDNFQQMTTSLTARSRAGSMASLDGINMGTSISGSVQDRSMSAQPMNFRSGSITGTPVQGTPTHQPTSLSEWPVDRLGSAAQFAACDADCDGLVNGNDVRHVLLATGLPQQALAKIWELSDINKTGTLNQEQFALIIHLVNGCRRGEELPTMLPPHLVPPSLRQLNIQPSAEENGIVPSDSSISLSSASQSENAEVRQLAQEMEKLLADRTEADEQVNQLEADMNVKNSAIKNLQIELQTLENTVKQLERQKMEANKRLGDLDEQIRQLEAAGAAQAAKGSETTARIEQLKNDAAEGAASAERDNAAIREAREELAQLDAEGRALSAELVAEQRAMEDVVGQITRVEADQNRGSKQQTHIEAEMEKVKAVTEQLKNMMNKDDIAIELKRNAQLLAAMERPELFSDSQFVSPSTSSNTGFSQPPDPFAGTQSGLAHVDPFAQTDPFAATNDNRNVLGAGFPADPFGAASFGQPATANKAPPPRPAPPKGRQTPVAEDPFSSVDPFAGQPVNNGASSTGFADFANFGAFN